MQVEVRAIPLDEIEDWPTFHDVFQRTMGFPDFNRRNMDAWIDCGSAFSSVVVRSSVAWRR